jgi:hypothetical protein
MGRLYDGCQQILRWVETEGLDPLKARGAIALEAGFLISMVEPATPDDPRKVEKLKYAAQKVLGIRLDI